LAAKTWTLVGIVLLISTVVASPLQTRQVSANGATRLIVNDQKVGPYLFRVGILPGNPKVGNLHLSILIQAAEGNGVIENGQMVIQATGPEPGMSAGPVQATNTTLNPQVFDADINLTALGSWTMTLKTVSELGAATLEVPLQVTESGGFNLMIAVVIVVVVLGTGALGWSQLKERKQPTRQ